MTIYTPPNEYSRRWCNPSIFIAGGISGCPDWQSEFLSKFSPAAPLVALNPRREHFDTGNPCLSVDQIEWEYRHLRIADLISFWFPKETLCPITLFELGSFINSSVPLVVGCHPDYSRRRDIEVQLRLARPALQIVYTLDDLYTQAWAYLSTIWNLHAKLGQSNSQSKT